MADARNVSVAGSQDCVSKKRNTKNENSDQWSLSYLICFSLVKTKLSLEVDLLMQ